MGLGSLPLPQSLAFSIPQMYNKVFYESILKVRNKERLRGKITASTWMSKVCFQLHKTKIAAENPCSY